MHKTEHPEKTLSVPWHMLFTSQCLYYFALPLLKTFMLLVLHTHVWIPVFKLNHSPSKNCPFASVWPAKHPYRCAWLPFPSYLFQECQYIQREEAQWEGSSEPGLLDAQHGGAIGSQRVDHRIDQGVPGIAQRGGHRAVHGWKQHRGHMRGVPSLPRQEYSHTH